MTAVIGDRYGTPDVLRVENVDRPEPGPGEVLVRLRAASVNTADLDNLAGRPRLGRIGTGLWSPRSKIPGLDMAGVVEKTGPGVSTVEVGTEVWADLFGTGAGSFAEYACVRQDVLRPKPEGISFDEAACVPHSAILALQAITSRGVSPGDRVLVNGGGGCVGPFAIQIARSLGAEVTGVDHGGKLDLMRAAGADHVMDYRREDVTRGGVRYDRIVDIASTKLVTSFKPILTESGSYVQIARNLRGFFQAALLGAIVGGKNRMGVFGWRGNDAADLRHLGDLLTKGDVHPIIDQRFPLSRATEAVAYQASGQARGKVVITMP